LTSIAVQRLMDDTFDPGVPVTLSRSTPSTAVSRRRRNSPTGLINVMAFFNGPRLVG
jgi:hypothetical protein